MSEYVIKDAIKTRDQLLEVSQQFKYRRSKHKELDSLDETTCEHAAELLQKLGTEVTRLRLTIEHYLYGRMGRDDLKNVVKTWTSGSDHVTLHEKFGENLNKTPERIGDLEE